MLSNEEIPSSFIFTKENIKDGKQIMGWIEIKKKKQYYRIGIFWIITIEIHYAGHTSGRSQLGFATQ